MLVRSNWISTLGGLMAFFGFVSLVMTLGLETLGTWQGPYLGILSFVLFPILIILGLLLVPAGLLVYRKKLHQRLDQLSDKPLYLARAVAGLTLINLIGVGTVGFEGVHYMSTVNFCGTTCHEAMGPEYRAYQDSPHAHVACVECHVGSGAQHYIQSKINGTRQLIEYVQKSYNRPIPTPVHGLRTARETCEECHWPERWMGTKIRVLSRYREDAENTPYTTVLLMRTGGTRPDGKIVGIHWHTHPKSVVEYIHSDEDRMEIPWVKVSRPDGTGTVYRTEGVPTNVAPEGERRTMDCTDCHNRAAHRFQTAEDAIDTGFTNALLSRQVPFLRKYGFEVLHQEWGEGLGEEAVAGAMLTWLQQKYAGEGIRLDGLEGELEAASKALAAMWRRNVDEHMRITWGTYLDRVSHDGCYRCHGAQGPERQGHLEGLHDRHEVRSERNRRPRGPADPRRAQGEMVLLAGLWRAGWRTGPALLLACCGLAAQGQEPSRQPLRRRRTPKPAPLKQELRTCPRPAGRLLRD
ncbi:MAG: NapC/NirT family cytochrome c [Planctomycetota bacterium]